ncbi:alpha/beta hydrolase [Vallitalea longa]|uniref:Alpha/beta hydrolase n=1 Tax=Vallitalea longa TaxID=2936439 RepID=A0A9W6DG40_9FIRM|nr:hypothetical protein [Vallitalea longa]GKX31906.1 alpha/beta hydrolase [Vallitalea longa]
MIKKTEISCTYNKKYKHLMLSQDNSRGLVVIYPGFNNSCNRPVLHYIRKAALEKRYDVLCINYAIKLSFNNLDTDIKEFLVPEALKLLNIVNNDKFYEIIYFIGKSLGTIISGKVRDEYKGYSNFYHIYLTPLKDSLPYINKYNGLLITGSKDKYFNKELLDQIINSNIKVEIIEDVNHALELNDNVLGTIDIHKHITDLCNNYL